MLASTKCYQLSLALQSMARKISYEDVQMAATYITQCATNVLTVKNFSFRVLTPLNIHHLFRLLMDLCSNEEILLI